MRASAFAALVVIGCAPMAYVEPTEGPTATLRIENQSPAIFGYELEAIAYQDPAACAGKLVMASTKQLPRGIAHNVRVAAEADFTLTLRGSGGGATRGEACTIAGTFRPLAGERYAAIFRVEDHRCQMLFVRQAPGPARRFVREASYRERHEPACL